MKHRKVTNLLDDSSNKISNKISRSMMINKSDLKQQS